jgi:hypothetical protein
MPVYGKIGPVPGTDFYVAIGHIPPGTTPTGWDAGTWDTDQWDGAASRLSTRDVPPGLTDVTCQVMSVTLNQGRDVPLERFRPGTATVTFYDPDGVLSPWATADDPTADTVTRVGMDMVIWCETPDGTLRRFTGIVDSIKDSFPNAGDEHTVQFDAVDYLSILASFTAPPVSPAVGAGELTGARMHRILLHAGYRGDTALDAGTIQVQGTTLQTNALDELGVTTDAEMGALWCNRNGTLVFRDRYAMVTDPAFTTVQAIFGDNDDIDPTEICYTDITLVSDLSRVRNVVTIGNVGGTPLTLSDTTSVALYRQRTFSDTSMIFADASDATNLAQQQLDAYAYAVNRIESLTVNVGTLTGDQLTAALETDLLYQIEVRRRATGFPVDAELQVQGISERVDANNWTITYRTFAAHVVTLANVWDQGIWDVSVWQAPPPPPPVRLVWRLGPDAQDKLDDGNVYGPVYTTTVWTMGATTDTSDEMSVGNVMGAGVATTTWRLGPNQYDQLDSNTMG